MRVQKLNTFSKVKRFSLPIFIQMSLFYTFIALGAETDLIFNSGKFEGKVISAELLDEQGRVVSKTLDKFSFDEKTGAWTPQGMMGQQGHWLGASFSEGKKESTKSFIFLDSMAEAMRLMNAQKSQSRQFQQGQKIPVVSTTKIISEKDGVMTLEITQSMMGFPQPSRKVRIRVANEFDGGISTIDPKDAPEATRKSLDKMSVEEKLLVPSVVRVVADKSNLNDSLMSMAEETDDNGHGTGFWLSKDGHLMTNHHVADGLPGCLRFHVCTFTVEQTLADGKIIKKKVTAKLLVADKAQDFALFQIQDPSNLIIKPLTLSKKGFGPAVQTIGYPGDQTEEDEDGNRKYKVTLANGSISSFMGETVSTTMHITGGASGSPVLTNGDVVGVISNGDGNPSHSPSSYFRPMALIEKKFQISQYLDGSKEKRIQAALSELQKSKTSDEAKKQLLLIEAESSFLGLQQIKEMMVCHANEEVRKEILESLERQGVAIGPNFSGSCGLKSLKTDNH